MADEGKMAVLSEDVRIVSRQEDSLMHNLANGAWCRVSRYAAEFFSRPEGIKLAVEAARMGNGDAVGMLRLAAELAETGMLVEKGSEAATGYRVLSKAYLISTRRCNLGCPHCYMGEPSAVDYPIDSLLQAASSMIRLKPSKVYITGGEPCMRDDLAEIIKAFDGLKVVLCTNGTMPERIPYNALKAIGATLQISMESCMEASHDTIRGPGSHKLAVESAKKAASYGIEVDLVPTIIPGSGFDFKEMINFAGSLGAGCHGSLMASSGKASSAKQKDERSLLSSMCEYLEKCVEKGEIEDDWKLEEIVPMLSRASCGAGSRILAFTGDGLVHPCHLLWDQPLDQDSIGASVDSNTYCRNCDVRYLCGGGCLAAARMNGGVDPNCGTYKAVYRAFAWSWDDSLTVRKNIRRIGGENDEMGICGTVCIQACD